MRVLKRFFFLHEWIDICLVLGAIASIVGTYWDIQYHVDIGRESFWIAPHLVVYGGTVLVLGASLLALRTVSTLSTAVRNKVRIAMRFIFMSVVFFLLGAPIDDLWHRIYGLDVTVWSPPHIYLIVMGFCITLSLIYFQRLYLFLTRRDRVRHITIDELGLEFMCALGLVGLNIIFAEFEFFQQIENFTFFHLRYDWIYLLGMAVLFPFILTLAKTLITTKWTATRIAFMYFLLRSAITLVLVYLVGGASFPMLPVFAFIPAVLFDVVYRKKDSVHLVWASGLFVVLLYSLQSAVFLLIDVPKYIPKSALEVAVAIVAGVFAAFAGRWIGEHMLAKMKR